MCSSDLEVMALGERSTGEWAKAMTGGEGVDFTISALGAKAPVETMLDSMKGVRRGGRLDGVHRNGLRTRQNAWQSGVELPILLRSMYCNRDEQEVMLFDRLAFMVGRRG